MELSSSRSLNIAPVRPPCFSCCDHYGYAVHPIAFEFGKLSIHWYGILTAVGLLLGFWTASRRGLRYGIPPEKVMDFAPWLLFSAIAGARILHVISYWETEFAGKPITEIFMVQKGGLVFYGGFIGVCIATIIYARMKKLPLWKLADVLAPSIALGHAFGRIGCLMTGCCFGKQCDLPWAIRFPVGHETHPTPVHPVQIYEAVLNFLLYLGLAWLYRRKKFNGQVFAAYLVAYAILRSVLELFRADYSASQYLWGTVSPGQLVSIIVITAGIILFWKLPRLEQRPK
jgi:phosphatidylglycerol:prolipoprotein diacylglycerol transferase